MKLRLALFCLIFINMLLIGIVLRAVVQHPPETLSRDELEEGAWAIYGGALAINAYGLLRVVQELFR